MLTLLTIGACFGVRQAQASWTEPTGSPPGGNVAAPLNISSTPQTKAGNLTIQGVFSTTGTINASASGSNVYAIQAQGNNVSGSMTLATGLYGKGGVATNVNTAASGVYGISYQGTPGVGLHVGLLGVAGFDSGNSVGVYGSDGGHPNSAYAGYFKGRVGIEGDLCLNGDCRSAWPSGGGGETLFTENPPGNTYLTNTLSNLALGGTSSDDAAFFFDVSASPGTFYAGSEVVIGPVVGGNTIGDHVCSPGETCSSSDCKGQPDSCPGGQVCDPAGANRCVVLDGTPPTVPQNLRLNGNVGATTAPLAWNASTDTGGSGLAGYKLYRCQGAGCTPTTVVQTLGVVTSFTDSGLSPNTTYDYEITAIDGAVPPNESGHSNRLVVTTAAGGNDATPPSVPQNLHVDGGTVYPTSVPLAWDASTDNPGGVGMAGYKVYKCQGQNCTPTTLLRTLGLITSMVDAAVVENTYYSYAVSAIDGASPPNESAVSTRLQVVTPNGGGGSSPIMTKSGGGTGGGSNINGGLPLQQTPNKTIGRSSYTEPAEQPVIGGSSPLSRLLSIPMAQAKIGFFAIPEAQAAGGFGGNPNIRLAINDGVLQIKDATTGNILELGNAGTDIASTSNILIRPGTATGAQGASFTKDGTATDLILTGALRLGNNAGSTPGTIRFNGSDIEGYVRGGWQSLTSTGGGLTADQVIWNSQNPPGSVPQSAASIKIDGSIFAGGELYVGPTYVAGNPTSAKFLVTAAGNVGIGLANLSPSTKLDVNGDINASGSFRQAGTVGTTTVACGAPGEDNSVLTSLDVRGGIVVGAGCETDQSGGTGSIGGGGTGGTIPLWTGSGPSTTLGDSLIFQDIVNNRIGIGTATPNARFVIADGPGNAALFRFSASSATTAYQTNFVMSDTGVSIMNNSASRSFSLGTQSTPRITITGPGLVGIGNNVTPNYLLDVFGQANATQLGLGGDFINTWSALIRNQSSPAQTANFNITGSGSIGTGLTVLAGPLELPSTSTTYRNAIEKYSGTLGTFNISQKLIFGSSAGQHWGLGIFADEDVASPTQPIVYINQDRQVHLGYAGNPTQLCLYGTGVADCKNAWPTGGGLTQDQVIWNSQNPPGSVPQSAASIKIDGSIFAGGELYIGPTYVAGNPTSAKLFVNSAGNVGIGLANLTPAAKLDVNGTVNSTGYLASGTAGISPGASCSGNNTVVGDLTVQGGIITSIGCETDDVGSGGGGIGGGGTVNFVPRFTPDGATLGNSQIFQDPATNFLGIGTTSPRSNFNVTSTQYNTGQASQVGTTITGTGTAWTPSMVGSIFAFADGTTPRTITAVNSGTSLTVNLSGTVAQQGYIIYYAGLNVTALGNVGIGNPIPNARLHIIPSNDNAVIIDPYGTGSGNTGKLKLMDLAAGGSHYAALRAPDTITTDFTLTLPNTAGTAGQVLQTDGTGALSWVTASGGLTQDQVIWNSQNPPGSVPQSAASIKIDGSVFAGGELYIGPTYVAGNPTSAKLFVNSAGNVGIGLANLTPAAKLDVNGTVNSTGYLAGGVAGVSPGASCSGNNIVVGDLTVQGGIITSIGCETDDSGGAGSINGGGTVNKIPLWTGATTLGDSSIFQISGNIGINNAAPNAKLQITPTTDSAIIIDPYGTGAGNTGKVKFMSLAANSHFIALRAPDQTTGNVDYTLTLPPDDGTAGQVLKTDGAGALSWVTPSGGLTQDQVIWNSQNPPGSVPQSAASIKIDGSIFAGGELYIGPTYVAGNPTSAKLFVNSAGNVGIGLANLTPAAKLDVNGTVNSTGYLASGTAGISPGASCSGNNTVVGDLTVQGGIITSIGCETDDSGGAGSVNGSGTANTIPLWTGTTPSTTLGNSNIVQDATGKVAVGTTAAYMGLTANGLVGSPAVNGTTQNGIFRVYGRDGSVLDFGVTAENPYSSWIQADDANNLASQYPLLLNPRGGNVGIGTMNPRNTLNITSLQYATGQASQSGTTATGVGTAWTSALVGGSFVFADGTTRTVISVTSGTQMTVSPTGTVALQNYIINYPGFNVTSSGNVGIGTLSPTSGARLHIVPSSENAIIVDPYGTNAGNTGKVKLMDLAAGGSHYAALRAPDTIATDYTLTLPPDDGAANQVLQTDGNGLLTWATPNAGFTADQLIWNSQNPPGAVPQSSASIKIDGSIFAGGELYVGPTYVGGNATKANLLVNTSGNVGIGLNGLNVAAKLDVNGNVMLNQYLDFGSNGGNGGGDWVTDYALRFWSGGQVMSQILRPASTRDLAFFTDLNDGSHEGVNDEIERMRILDNGRVGIGTTAPTALLTVASSSAPYASNHSLAAYNNATSAYNAVSGFKSGTTMQGSGVYGELVTASTCASGQVCAGVYGTASDVDGSVGYVTGVYGKATDADAYAGFFQSTTNVTNSNVNGWVKATLRAHNNSVPSGADNTVVALSASTGAATPNNTGGPGAGRKNTVGLFANASASALQDISFRSIGAMAHGGDVSSASSSSNNTTFGVLAYGGSDLGGGSGSNLQTYGVYAVGGSLNTNAGYENSRSYGIYAASPQPSLSNSYAGYFSGNVTISGNLVVTGSLSKGSGSFTIDDPLDPANKYLQHSFVESPDMKNVYDGVVSLDAQGTAWVTLPSYFEALNKDYRYQLTPVGSAAAGLYVKDEVTGNRFRIAGGAAYGKVSWQVTGTRKDPYAEAHPIQVEVLKSPEAIGKYLYPELYGKGQDQKTTIVP